MGNKPEDQSPTGSQYPLDEQLTPPAELPSYPSYIEDPSHPYGGGHAALAALPGRSHESRGSLIIAVVVMIAIVIASIVILFDPFDADTAGLPSGALSAGDSGNVSARPTSAPSPSPSTGSRIGPTTSAGTGEAPRTGAPTQTAGRAPAEAGTAVSGAAKLAAKSWVDALNKQRVGPAQALSCAAVRPKITASFVATVAGSIKVVSILKDPSAGTTTLTFSYRKTTDTARQRDRLSLITEAGSWKVCT